MVDSFYSNVGGKDRTVIRFNEDTYWVTRDVKEIHFSFVRIEICDYCKKQEFRSRSNPYYFIELIEDVPIKDEINYKVCPDCYKGVGKSLNDAKSFKVFMSLLKIRKGK